MTDGTALWARTEPARRALVGLGRPVRAAAVTAEASSPWMPPPGPDPRHARARGAWTIGVLGASVTAMVISGVELNATNDAAGKPVAPALVFLALALSGAPLALTLRWPLAAFRVAVVGAIAAVGLTGPLLTDLPFPVGLILTIPATTFAAVDRARADIAAGAVAVGLLGLVVVANVTQGDSPDVVWVWSALVLAASAVFAATVRSRRLAQGALVVEEARTAEQRAARAVLEERARIARELHDVVAHHMSAVAIQAEAAPLRHPDDPAALRQDLAEIRVTALSSMREMRRILGVLRDGAGGPADRAPVPTLDDLEELVATAQGAGLDVTVERLGDPVPLSVSAGLSAYRIIQESLSNAMRHAPGATVAVTVTYRRTPPLLTLDVHSSRGDGSAAPPSEGAGHGLVGMRERAAALGGQVHAGPAADGGFLVHARLPLEAT